MVALIPFEHQQGSVYSSSVQFSAVKGLTLAYPVVMETADIRSDSERAETFRSMHLTFPTLATYDSGTCDSCF